MIEALFLRVATLSFTCSAVLFPLLLLAPRLRGRYAAKSFYVLWLLLALRLAIPIQLTLPRATVIVQAPNYEITLPGRNSADQIAQAPPVQTQNPTSGGVEQQTPLAPALGEGGQEEQTAPQSLSLTQMLAVVWLTGTGCFLIGQIGCYFLARRALLKTGRFDPKAQKLADGLRGQLGIKTRVALYRTSEVDTPTMLGYWKPVILLPQKSGGAGGLELILHHELLHRKRRDVLYKSVLLLANALHWFNPLVWWMGREAGRNLELCCDRDLVQGESPAFCRQYGEVLLQAAASRQVPAFSTQFGGGKAQLKERLMNLFQRKRRGWACMAVILAAALLVSGLVACESQEESASYSNEAFHYTVELPQSWAGKFTATESQNGGYVEFAQKNHGENDGVFFWLTAWNEEQWDRLPEDETLDLYEMELGRKDGVVITYGFPTDVRVDTGNQEIADEYAQMEEALREAGGVKLAFTEGEMPQVLDTGRQYTNELWGFTLTLPERAADQYVIKEYPSRWEFYHRASYETTFEEGYPGWIGAVSVDDRESLYGSYGDNPEENFPVQMTILGEKEDKVFYIYFASDVQYAPELQEEYRAVSEAFRAMTSENFQFTDDQIPVPTDAGYLLEAPKTGSVSFQNLEGGQDSYPLREGQVPVFVHYLGDPFLGEEISYSEFSDHFTDYAGDTFRLYLKDGAVWYIEQVQSRQDRWEAGRSWPVEDSTTILRAFEEGIHAGVDIQAEPGQEILVVTGGTVTEAGQSEALGNYVVVAHDDTWSTVYGHLDQIAVSRGDTLGRGEVVGTAAAEDGRAWVHYGSRWGAETYVDPLGDGEWMGFQKNDLYLTEITREDLVFPNE